jgi:hypothetical protein
MKTFEKIDDQTEALAVPTGIVLRTRYWSTSGCSIHTLHVPMSMLQRDEFLREIKR